MARPTVIPEWATAITPATPSAGSLQSGAVAGQAANPDDANWTWKYTSQWSTYLSELSSATGILDGATQLGSDAASTSVLGSTVAIVGGSVTAEKVTISTTDGAWTLSQAGGTGAILAWDDAIGVTSLFGVAATAGTVTDALRFAYTHSGLTATPLTIEYQLTDGPGGWTALTGGSQDIYLSYDLAGGGGVLYHYDNSSSGTIFLYYRDLSWILGRNPEATAASTAVHEIVSIAGGYDATNGAGGSILVQMCAEARSTGAITVLLTLPSTGTGHTGGPATDTDSLASPHAVDLSANRYYLRVQVVGAGTAGYVKAEDLKLTIRKSAVE